MPGASFEAVTGRLGIGAIAFLGLFLIVDGTQIGVFELLEAYGSSVTWGIVGVVPTAVVIYIVGVFCLGVAELLLARFAAFRDPEPKDVLAISRSGGALLQQSYADHMRNHELLKGAAVSFLILSGGAMAEFPNMRGYESIVWLATIGSLALSTLSLVFSHRAVAQARHLARTARSAPDA